MAISASRCVLFNPSTKPDRRFTDIMREKRIFTDVFSG
jgi:hypothetical protein